MAARINTVRDHQERLNKVLLHIQAHPDVPYSLTQLARVACFSPFHFHRLFVAYVGEPLNVHLRRLRLERAAQQLCLSRRAVTDIALDAGYETSPAFNKAFQQLFRVSPTEFRQTRPSVISSTLKLQSYTPSAKSMKPKIITRPTKQLVFVRRTGSYGQSASEAWEAVCHFAYSRQLVKPGREFIGISHDDPQITAEDKLRYDACITVSGSVQLEGEVGVQTLAGGTYAVFLHKGPYENLGQTYQCIFRQWLPESGRQLRDVPSFELYLNSPGRTKPENLRTEIHIPLQ